MSDAFAWWHRACPSLKESKWAPALESHGVDVLDALMMGFVVRLLKFARTESSDDAEGVGPFLRSSGRYASRVAGQRIGELWGRISSGRATKAPVVFWPVEPTHLEQQVPVSDALASVGVKSLFVACRSSLLQDPRMLKRKAVFTKAQWAKAIRDAERIGTDAVQVAKGDPAIVLPPFVAPCDDDSLIGQLRQEIRNRLPLVHRTIAVVDRIAAEIAPRAIVVGNDITPQGRAVSLRAKHHGIATACIMHGRVSGDCYHGSHCADKMLVFGESSRAFIVESGIGSMRIEVCGAPYLDSMPSQTGMPHQAIRSRHQIIDGQSWILVATSGPGKSISRSHHETAIRNVMRITNLFDDVVFVAKLHRKDSMRYYQRARVAVGDNSLGIVPNKTRGYPTSIFDWLQGCRAVLTGASTVAIEAMLMGVPVITMDFADELRGIDFIDDGSTLHVRSEKELEAAVLDVVGNRHRLKEVRERSAGFLEKSFFRRDGKSSLRAAWAIKNLIDESHEGHSG